MSNAKIFALDNNNYSRIAQLIIKGWKGTLTPEEEQEMEQLRNSSAENKQYFDSEISNHALLQLMQYELNNSDLSKKMFTKGIDIHDRTPEPGRKRLLLTKATGLVFVAAIAAWLFLIVKTPPSAHNVLPDFANHVVLTLGNGTSILADTVKDNLYIEQGDFLMLLHRNEVRYISVPYKQSAEKQATFNEVRIPAGKLFKIVLPDLSEVFLNAASFVRLPVSGAEGSIRKLELSGEGYFDVQTVYKDKNKLPFVVSARAAAGLSLDITVVGTKFNVNAYGNASEIKTTLEEGAIKVSNNGKTILLSAGEQLRTGRSFNRKTRDCEIKRTRAWKDGNFSYSNATLQDVLQDVERWYGVHVILEEDITKRITIVKIPRSSSITSVLSSICGSIECNYLIQGNQIRIIKHR